MKLLGVFLAEDFSIRDGKYDIQGAGLGSAVIENPNDVVIENFQVCMLMVCEAAGDEFGNDIALSATVIGPSGNKVVDTVTNTTVRGPTAFASMKITTPFEGTGRYVYQSALAGTPPVVAPLDVTVDGQP